MIDTQGLVNRSTLNNIFKDSLISMWHFNGTQFHPVVEVRYKGRKQHVLFFIFKQ